MTDPEQGASPAPSNTHSPMTASWPGWTRSLLRVAMRGVGVLAAAAVAGAILAAIALAVAYPNLPDISGLTDYRPKLPMRLYSSDGVLLAEYGEEKRHYLPISKIPKSHAAWPSPFVLSSRSWPPKSRCASVTTT